jgi:branched-chain amino acid transport system substrate-binding protein
MTLGGGKVFLDINKTRTGSDRMKKSVVVILSVMIAFAMLAGVCEAVDRAIKVGLIAELTGDIPAVGASCKDAAEMAVREINKAGGIAMGNRKYRMELFIEDSSDKPKRAADAARKLITRENVIAIVGPNSSSNAIPASGIAEASKVVLITPWSTNPKVTIDARTGKPGKYVFRATFIDTFQGRVLAKFAMDTMKAKKAAVLYDAASEYSKGIAEIFRQTFEEMGGTIVAFESYPSNEKDFSPQLIKIRDSSPDVVFLPDYYDDVPLQVRQAHSLGIKAPFLGSDSWGSHDLVKLCGKDCEGCYFSAHYSADSPDPATRKFVKAYTAAYGKKPDDVAALTYDSFGLLRQALIGAGKLDRQALRDALAVIRGYEGVTGRMRFRDDSGDPVKSAVILQIKDGRFVWVADVQP